MTEQVSARDLFRSAYENRYTWDKNFPGYSADITLQQGEETFTGTVRVNPNLSIDISGIDNEQAKSDVLNQLREIAIHRVRRSFEETHGKNTFEYGDTDADGGVEILIGGKASGDRYKIRNNEVSLVHRHIHGVVVTINTASSHDTGAGYLSHRYDSVYHDGKTGEPQGGLSQFEDNYAQVGDYWLLTDRTIRTEADGKITTTQYGFSNVKLLQPVAV